jgi:hypothetical protein
MGVLLLQLTTNKSRQQCARNSPFLKVTLIVILEVLRPVIFEQIRTPNTCLEIFGDRTQTPERVFDTT